MIRLFYISITLINNYQMVKNCIEVMDVNSVGKYALSDGMDELQLMNMVFELPEKDRMLMWVHDYIDIVIDRLPIFAKDILEKRQSKWDDSKAYIQDQISFIVVKDDFQEAAKKTRKEFAHYVIKNYPQYQSLLFSHVDRKLKESDIRKFVYHRRFSSKRPLQ
jgi:hypothetical protein